MPQSVPQSPQSAQDFQGGQKIQVGKEFQRAQAKHATGQDDPQARGQAQHDQDQTQARALHPGTPLISGKVDDLAFDATLRAAALHQKNAEGRRDKEIRKIRG